jgi:hypothetical protein
MRFEPVPGAYQYEITVRKPDNALMYRSFVVTNLERVTDVPTGRTYIWRVRAQCNDETITPYSAPDTILMPAAFTWESRPEKIQGADQVKVSYPNASLAMISPSDPTGVSELMVFDLLGHMVFVQNHIQHWPVEVNYSSWPAGLYVVRINALEKRLTGRMVVQR